MDGALLDCRAILFYDVENHLFEKSQAQVVGKESFSRIERRNLGLSQSDLPDADTCCLCQNPGDQLPDDPRKLAHVLVVPTG